MIDFVAGIAKIAYVMVMVGLEYGLGVVLKYKDFVPCEVVAPGIFSHGEYESFDAAVEAANQWLIDSNARMLKLETVVLPNIHSRWEEGSADASIGTSGDSPSQWHQFLRVWYQE